jgi:hypothetical protein
MEETEQTRLSLEVIWDCTHSVDKYCEHVDHSSKEFLCSFVYKIRCSTIHFEVNIVLKYELRSSITNFFVSLAVRVF